MHLIRRGRCLALVFGWRHERKDPRVQRYGNA
jgi:hypothetical protein